jgi:hypothetical protein
VTETVDAKRVAIVARDVMAGIVAHFKQGPNSADRVLEVLNALAFATATVLVGATREDDMAGCQEALAFFDLALQQNLAGLIHREKGNGGQHPPTDH